MNSKWYGTLVLALFGLDANGLAQAASNVRAASNEGQVFVVWDYDTVNPPETYEVYFGPTPFTHTSQATKIGRLFADEWKGERLQLIAGVLGNTNSTWEVPTPLGRMRLGTDEGLFVFTPKQSLSGYFAVVPFGSTTVTGVNRSNLITIAYDPISSPVRPQLQLTGTSPQGNPYKIFAVWALGSNDPLAGRPDYPVTGNLHKNGAPNLFCVYEPVAGTGSGPYPAVFGLHGGEGNFQFWRPGIYPNIGLEITAGLFIAPTDSLVYKLGTSVSGQNTRWYGYANTFDPFSGNVVNQEPPVGSVIVDYTARRFHWFLDWLLGTTSGYQVDADRVSLIGQSMGGRGVNILMRTRPERFASVVMLTPVLEAPMDTPNAVFGSELANFPTNLAVAGQTLSSQQMMYWTQPLSTNTDFPFTRIYSGKNDGTALWNTFRTNKYEEVNKLGLGWHLFWDSRVHGIAAWTDPPAGEYVAPIRTDLASAMAQHRYRAKESFPAFFCVDADPAVAGYQPNLGNATSTNPGDVFGTLGGFCEWDSPVETPKTWHCDLYIRKLAAKSIDNWPGMGAFTCSVTARRLQTFALKRGRGYSWTLRRLDTQAFIAKGSGYANSLGQPTAEGVTLYPETTTKVRLEFRLAPSRR